MDSAIIEKAALELSVSERAMLVDRLFQTLGNDDADIMAKCGFEADRRLEAFDRGMDSTDGPNAVAALRRRLS